MTKVSEAIQPDEVISNEAGGSNATSSGGGLTSAALVEQNNFSVGDFVKVISDPVRIKRLQRGHGEWAEQMFQRSRAPRSLAKCGLF